MLLLPLALLLLLLLLLLSTRGAAPCRVLLEGVDASIAKTATIVGAAAGAAEGAAIFRPLRFNTVRALVGACVCACAWMGARECVLWLGARARVGGVPCWRVCVCMCVFWRVCACPPPAAVVC